MLFFVAEAFLAAPSGLVFSLMATFFFKVDVTLELC